jgi:putative inorganic carbon (hco3(-)) transporter
LIENSLLYRLTSNLYSASQLKKVLNFSKQWLAMVFLESFLIKAIRNAELKSEEFDGGVFTKLLNAILNFPLILLKLLFNMFADSWEGSVTLKWGRILLKPFDGFLSIGIFILLVIPDHLWNNFYSLLIVLVLLMLFVLRAVMYKHKGFEIRDLGIYYPLFFLVVLMSFLTSIDSAESFRFFLFHLTCFLMVLLIVSGLKTNASLSKFIETFITGVFFTALFALWQVFTNSVPFDPSLTDLSVSFGLPGRVYSTMVNPNNFAQLLVMAFPFTIAMMSRTHIKIHTRIRYAIYALALLFAIAFTGSRSGWVGLLVALFVFLIIRKPSWLPLLGFLGIMVIPFLPDFILRRFLTLTNSSVDSSIAYRGKINQTLAPMTKDFWFTGVGLGTDVFMRISGRYFQYTSKIPVHSHILYTQIILEMGVVGLITFLITVLKNIKNGVVAFFNTEDSFLSNIIAAGVASLAGILVIGFVEYVWYYPRIMLIFWVIMGIIFSSIAMNRRLKLKTTEGV